MAATFEQKLAGKYPGLSPRLREAADFVLAHPIDVATRTLRSVAQEARLTPATFSRMATALGYENYEALREVLRQSMAERANSFSTRAAALQEQHGTGDHGFHAQHLQAMTRNLHQLAAALDVTTLERCVEHLHQARKVLVLGGLGSTGIAEYIAYMAGFVADNWSMGLRMGASLGSGLEGLGADDVLLVITNPPFATSSILAAEAAQAAGACVIVLTDSHSCPALKYASESFILPSESPHFFSSYAATLALAEVLTGMLAKRAGSGALERIAAVETRNRQLGEVWSQSG
ncbi:MurR/RpiR family transcriptional regulator [Sulfitobacter aestuarii]|uniref:MurR/RpiR family transcriptional regulator n=1 Tax=Sulfitobacter aestuarii TaxID=2161676 RepID=A0ABW5U167_9RHOB